MEPHPEEDEGYFEARIAGRNGISDQGRPGDRWLSTRSAGRGAPASSSTSAPTCGCGCGRRPRTRPVRVFAANLRDLLLAAPAGTRATMGLDPGSAPASRWPWSTRPAWRWATATIYPHVPQNKVVAGLWRRWPGSASSTRVDLIAIGNGTRVPE
jgi:uncharacterized protein